MERNSLRKIVYLIRKNLTNSKIFYSIYFFFKFNGLILSSQNLKNYEENNNIKSYYTFCSKILLFHKTYKLINYNYQTFCIIIFISNIIFFLCFYIIYKKIKHIYLNSKGNTNLYLNKYLSNKKHLYFLVKILAYYLLYISTINQHLGEYLSIGIITPFVEKDILNSNKKFYFSEKNKKYFFKYLNNELYLDIHIICVLNIFSFIFIYIYEVLILELNDIKSLFSINGIDLYNCKIIKYLIVIFSMFHPLISISILLNKNTKKTYRYVLNSFSLFLTTIFLFFNYKKFRFYFHSFVPLLNLFFVCFSWNSSILEFIISSKIKDSNDVTGSNVLSKLISEIFLAFFLEILLLNININYFKYHLSLNLFEKQENSSLYIAGIYIYITEILNFNKNEQSNSNYFFDIFNDHKKLCKNENCYCVKVYKKIISNLISYNKKELFKIYTILGEQEINNKIYEDYENKNFSESYEDLIVLHCQYLFHIRRRYNFALYVANKYLNTKIRLTFLTQYFLYEIKKEIISEIKKYKIIENDDNQFNINENYFFKDNKSIKNVQNFFNYLKYEKIIKKIIKINFENLTKIFAFRKEIKQNSKIITLNKHSFQIFVNSCKLIKKNDKKLKLIILNKSEFKNKDTINNNEMCYLLTNYFLILHKKIPKKLKGYFLIKDRFKYIYKNLDFDFYKFHMKYPMIITLNKTDSFNITYINSILCESLGYNYDNIKGMDFNELLPSFISKEHNLIMKQFIFIKYGFIKNRNSYILDKNKTIIDVLFNCQQFPSVSKIFSIICDFYFLEEQKKDSNLLTYVIFLDKNFNFLNIAKLFKEQFYFDLDFFITNNINFCDFFGIDIEKLKKKFNLILSKYEKNENKNNIQNLEEKDFAFKIFAKIPTNDKIFDYREDKKDSRELFNKVYEFKDVITETNINKGLLKISKSVLDKELNINLLNKIKCLSKRYNVGSKALVSINESFISYEHVIIPKVKKKKMEVDYFLKCIGNRKYILVKLKEEFNIDINNILEVPSPAISLKKPLSIQNSILKDFTNTNFTLMLKRGKTHNFEKVNKIDKNFNKNKNFLEVPENKNNKNDNNNNDKNNKNNKDNDKNNSDKNNNDKNNNDKNNSDKNNNDIFIENNFFKKKNFSSNNQKIYKNNFLNTNYFYKKTKKKNSKFEEEENINSSMNNNNSNLFLLKEKYINNDPNLKKINQKKEKNQTQKQNSIILETIENEIKRKEEEEKKYKEFQKNKEIILKLTKNKISNIKEIFYFINNFILIILAIVFLLLKISKIDTHKILFHCNTTLEMIKSDIFFIGLNSINYCFDLYYNNLFSLNYSKIKLKNKIDNLRKDFTNLYLFLFQTINNNKLKFLYDKLYETREYNKIKKNWDFVQKKSNLLSEIDLLIYLASENYLNSEGFCNISYFLEMDFINFSTYQNITEKPTVQEELYIYMTENIFDNYKGPFDSIIKESTNILLDYYKSYYLFVIIYGLILYFLLFIHVILVWMRLTKDKKEVFFILKNIFSNDIGNKKEEKKVEKKVIYYKKLIDCFNGENINKFEKIDDKYNQKITFYDVFEDKNNVLKTEKNKKFKLKKNKTLKNYFNNDNNENNEKHHKIFKTTEIRKSILYKDYNINKNSISSLMISSKSIKKKLILPRSLRYSFRILIGFLILMLILIIVNILYSNFSKKNFSNSVIMGMNYLERITSFLQLVFYVEESVLGNDVNFISYKENYSLDYLNYYKIKEDINNYTQLLQLSSSFYVNLYFQALIIEKNIRIFENKKTNILNNVKKMDNLFNIKDNICIAASEGSLYNLEKSYSDVFKYFSELYQKFLYCHYTSSEVEKYGLSNEIDFILQELTNNFLDFALLEKNVNNIYNFFQLSYIKRITMDFDYVFQYICETYNYYIFKDIINIYDSVELIEIIISYIILIMIFTFFLYSIFIKIKNKNYKKLFIFFYKLY